MRKSICLTILGALLITSCQKAKKNEVAMDSKADKIRLMTLDPGHFHAALIQKSMYEEIDAEIHVFAPEGPEVSDFLQKIEQYNTREEHPTQWKVATYLGDDYLHQMIDKKPGNVMVVAGKNSKKIDYILEAVKAGLNVYADKPLVIDRSGYQKLIEAFEIARKNNVIIYDIMTERFEITTILQKYLSQNKELFGDLQEGSIEDPAISKESVHHFFKYVSGKPLVRPGWFFDVNEEGDGIVDVTTHLVDLIQWEAFPDEIIKKEDIELLSAKRWPTILTKEDYFKVTGLSEVPDYLKKDLIDDQLHVYSNGEMIYRIRGKVAKVSVTWNYQAPEGTGDTHYSMMRGTQADLIIEQGESESYKPTLYIVPKSGLRTDELKAKVESYLGKKYDNIVLTESGDRWKVIIPEELKVGHEAHFAQVTQNYLNYLANRELPEWEVPNMLTKYHVTTSAYEMARSAN